MEDVQRKVGVVMLNGQKLELSCDIKAVCKDVLDMVVAHIGLVEHHLFGLAYLKGLSLTHKTFLIHLSPMNPGFYFTHHPILSL